MLELEHPCVHTGPNGNRFFYGNAYNSTWSAKLNGMEEFDTVVNIAVALDDLSSQTAAVLPGGLAQWLEKNDLARPYRRQLSQKTHISDWGLVTENKARVQALYSDVRDLMEHILNHPRPERFIAILERHNVSIRYCHPEKGSVSMKDAQAMIGVFSGDRDSVLAYAAEIAGTPVPDDIILYEI